MVQTPFTRVNLVSIAVQPEHAAAFRQIALAQMAQSIKTEAGVLAMYAATDVRQPEKWYFFEIYESEAAYQAHRKTPHFQRYLRDTRAMIGDQTLYDITPSDLGNKGGFAFGME